MAFNLKYIVLYTCLTICLYGNTAYFTNGDAGANQSKLVDAFQKTSEPINGGSRPIDVPVGPTPTTDTPTAVPSTTSNPNNTTPPETTTTTTTTTPPPPPPPPPTPAPITTPTPNTTHTPPTTIPTPNTTTTAPVTTTSPITTSTPNITTPIPPTSTTTSPITTTSQPVPTPDRRYDGPSFIGGIVFTLGLMAIGFVSWKFYKARTERNYHTL